MGAGPSFGRTLLPLTVACAALVAPVGGCASAGLMGSPQTRVAIGTWGGDHIGLIVTDAGGQIEFDCASGRITRPLAVDAGGRGVFDGIYLQERGGPVRLGQEPEPQPARYAARVTGKTMTLDVTLAASGAAIGSFSLTHGGGPRVKKCR